MKWKKLCGINLLQAEFESLKIDACQTDTYIDVGLLIQVLHWSSFFRPMYMFSFYNYLYMNPIQKGDGWTLHTAMKFNKIFMYFSVFESTPIGIYFSLLLEYNRKFKAICIWLCIQSRQFRGRNLPSLSIQTRRWKNINKNQRIIKKKDIFIESIRTWDPQNTNRIAVGGLNHWIMLKTKQC